MVPFHVNEGAEIARLQPHFVILDYDWWTDVDDVVAARLAAWAHTENKWTVLAAGISTTFNDGAPSLDGFLASEGITGIPIGVPKTAHTPTGSPPFQATMRTRTAAFVDPERVYRNAVVEYRTALAESDGNVDLVVTGFLNNIQELMNSPADAISPLTGSELITYKVRFMYLMGGQYPSGIEHNFAHSAIARAAANDVVANFPRPILYSGYEVGASVVSGGNLAGTQASDILAQAMLDHGSASGRPSWDPMTTLLAIAQNPILADYQLVRGSNSVNASTGANIFTANAANEDWYSVKSKSDASYVTVINNLLVKSNWGSYNPYP